MDRKWEVIKHPVYLDTDDVFVGLADKREEMKDYSLRYAEEHVCKVYDDKFAQLIAAAPEMLEALELALATLDRVESMHKHGPFSTLAGTISVVKNVIAKAEGKEKG